MIYESEEGLIKETLPKRARYFIVVIAVLIIFLILFVLYVLFLGPRHFTVPTNSTVSGVVFEVKPGEMGATIASHLKEQGIISSANIFNLYTLILGDSKKFIAGYYFFTEPTGIIQAEKRLANGDFKLSKIKITFPEGFTVKQIADRLAAQLPLFDREKFWVMASTSEGYLFPETYFFLPGDSEREALSAMALQFRESTKGLFNENLDKNEIVIMASIIQKEVKGLEDMKIVSGIFWKRIKMKMALQADSTLDYERNKTSAELTLDDLKKDSPYNTYTRRGLPPTPIDSPGLDAIKAALNPTASDYLYFLTGKDGKVYYAKTFEEHKKNKAKYL